jgi:hypothetical protein
VGAGVGVDDGSAGGAVQSSSGAEWRASKSNSLSGSPVGTGVGATGAGGRTEAGGGARGTEADGGGMDAPGCCGSN